MTIKEENGNIEQTTLLPVKIKGGVTYGQSLITDINYTPKTAGYKTVEAELMKGKNIITEGEDQLFVVKLDAENISRQGSIADTTGILQRFMTSVGYDYPTYTTGTPKIGRAHV